MDINDVAQPWNGEQGRVWAPDTASGKIPLVVYLHGLINDKIASASARMIADDATLKADGWSMSTGNLVEKMIKDGKIKPVAIAAPGEKLSAAGGGALWKTLDFSGFVDEVVTRLAAAKIQVDLSKLTVVGWSGAGCNDNTGLHKIAQEVGKGKYKLYLMGCADTCVTTPSGTRIQTALGNASTIVYSIHEGAGGGGEKHFDEAGYLKAYGVTRDLKKKGETLPSAVEVADKDAFVLYMDNGDGKKEPTRTVAKVAGGKAGLELHWSYFEMPKRQAHGQVPLVWTWYALQRYFKK
jgi:hypothetical protein